MSDQERHCIHGRLLVGLKGNTECLACRREMQRAFARFGEGLREGRVPLSIWAPIQVSKVRIESKSRKMPGVLSDYLGKPSPLRGENDD